MSIKHPNVSREDYDKLHKRYVRWFDLGTSLERENASLKKEVNHYKTKKEAAERLFWMLNRNRNKDISFWKQGFIATAIGMVVFFINSILFC